MIPLAMGSPAQDVKARTRINYVIPPLGSSNLKHNPMLMFGRTKRLETHKVPQHPTVHGSFNVAWQDNVRGCRMTLRWQRCKHPMMQGTSTN